MYSSPELGIVGEMPNVNPVVEMVDMMEASRAYEANATMIQSAKNMFNSALSIIRY